MDSIPKRESSSKHTPGPWSIPPVAKGIVWTHILIEPTENPNDLIIAQIPWHDQTSEADANAHLIAAAPDLLAACQALLAYIDDADYAFLSSGNFDGIRAAIAKAGAGE